MGFGLGESIYWAVSPGATTDTRILTQEKYFNHETQNQVFNVCLLE
jgi:hypothetical protein